MRKILISLAFIFLTLLSFAQKTALTENKIIEDGKEFYLYEVQESEGFMAIGRKFGIAYKDIVDANTETIKDGLHVGQILRIPVVDGRNTSKDEIKLDQFVYHKVEPGETLFFISRRYGVSIRDIVKNNPGTEEVLSLGMELKIPKVTEAATINYKNQVDTPQMSSAKDTFNYHTVRPKETAYGISRKYTISIEELAMANPGLNVENIPIGTKLRIPKSTDIIHTLAVSEELTDTRYLYHRIKNGETLETIAALYSIPVQVIQSSNAIGDNLPPVGYMLKIPHAYEFSTEISKEQQVVYIVQKKDDIREIAEQYQVPIMDIKAANPDVKKWTKLKKGEQLIIPTLLIESVDSLVTRIPENKQKEDLLRYFEKQKVSLGDTINVAFLWPLYLEHNDTINVIKKVNPQTHEVGYQTRHPKMIYPGNPLFREFYFGALIALNDLKSQGLVVNVKNYDTERGLINILKVLEDSTLLNADIIFGPAFHDHSLPVSKFCMKNHIRLVLPFISECDCLESNPYIYQVVPSPGVEYASIVQEVVKRYANSNIILVKGDNGDKRETLFAELLKSELYYPDSVLSHEISYKEINFSIDKMSGLSALLDQDKHNLIIIPAEKEKFYTLVIPILENYISRHKKIDIKLLGFSEWQNFKGVELENIFNVECEIHTPFYADILSDESQINDFKTKYSEYFLTIPDEEYPYYGMLGYDVTSFFMKGLHTYGNLLENNLENIDYKGLCVNFDFERVNNWGGFVNKTIYTIDYTKEFDIKKVK